MAANHIPREAESVTSPHTTAPFSSDHRSVWNATMARFLKEEAAADRYGKSTFYPAFKKMSDSKIAIPRHVDEEYDRLVSIADDTRWELMAMPAPDRVSVRWKLDHLLKDDGTGSVSPWAIKHLDQTMADYRRLLSDA